MEKPESDLISVEVAYALPDRQRILTVQVKPGCTALQAAELSGITREFPELDLAGSDMGIFSKNLDGKQLSAPAEYVLKAKDRVEIYRPLQADPKVARAQRAAKVKEQKASGQADEDTADRG